MDPGADTPMCVLQKFLAQNKLRLILRSHEGPDARFKRDDMPPVDQGYALDHDCQSETACRPHSYCAPSLGKLFSISADSNNHSLLDAFGLRH